MRPSALPRDDEGAPAAEVAELAIKSIAGQKPSPESRSPLNTPVPSHRRPNWRLPRHFASCGCSRKVADELTDPDSRRILRIAQDCEELASAPRDGCSKRPVRRMEYERLTLTSASPFIHACMKSHRAVRSKRYPAVSMFKYVSGMIASVNRSHHWIFQIFHSFS
jgi:hypothetical protein